MIVKEVFHYDPEHNDHIKSHDEANNIAHLKAIREYLSDDDYRRIYAAIITKDYVNYMKLMNIELNREEVHQEVNKKLIKEGIEPISYGFIRKFY